MTTEGEYLLPWNFKVMTSYMWKLGVGKFLALTIDACIKYLKVSLINRKIINFPRHYRLCLPRKLIFVLDNFMVTPADVKFSV